MTNREEVARRLIRERGTTYAEEWHIELGRGTPSPLFRLLCGALLASARISASIATKAVRGLTGQRLTTAKRMRDSSWDQRVAVLHAAGYTRYQERTATMLGKAAESVLEDYGGDLRQLRETAKRDPARERRLLERIAGMGNVGAGIFLREVQVIWPEVRPFADKRALQSARRHGLPAGVGQLERMVGADDLPRLVAALVRSDIEG